jgi:sugar lactone lactonase YvrE
MANNAGHFEPSPSNGYTFINASSNDLVLYGTDATKKMLMGTVSNAYPNISMGASNLVLGVMGNTSSSTVSVNVNNGATNAITVLGTGNVGIGTSTPGYKLDVTGDVRFSGSLYQGSNLFTSSGGGSGVAGMVSVESNNAYSLSTTQAWSVVSPSTTYVPNQAMAVDGTSTDVAYGVHFDANANVVVCGSFSNASGPTVYNANGSNSGLSISSSGNGTAFAVKYDSNGTASWTAAVDGTGVESANAVAVDSDGAVILAGSYDSSSATIYGSGGQASSLKLPTPTGSSIAFAVKYGSTGDTQWAVGVDGAGVETANAVATDSGKNVVLAGSYMGPSASVLSLGTTSSPYPLGAYTDVSTFAGSGVDGFSDATGTNAQFSFPTGACVDSSGNVYVIEYSNQRIRKITPAGVVTTLAGSATAGFSDATGTNAQFSTPSGISADSTGNVYVADTNNHRIRKITPAGVVTTLAGSGISGFSDATGTNSQFSSPMGICVDSSGNVYVGDSFNHCIRKITPAGVVTTLAGSGVSGFSDATGTNAQFNGVRYGVSVDASGNVYVADSSNHRVRKVTSAGVVTTLAGSGTPGFSDATGTNAQFNALRSVWADASGNVYVVDTSNRRIRMVTAAGVVTTLAGSGVSGFRDATGTLAQFDTPTSIGGDPARNLYVADFSNHRIRRIEMVPVDVMTMAGSGVAGFSDATWTNAQFNSPDGICVDSSGNVYVSDSQNHRIRKITPVGVVTTLAGSGTAGFSNATGTNAQFRTPTSVAVDSSGNVYVGDYSNHCIRKITPAGVVTTLAGSGVSGFSDATGTNAQFNNPRGVCVDTGGNVYVSDSQNHRIRKITPAGVVTTLAGSGTAGFSDATGTNAQFNGPTGVSVNSSGNVYVSDCNNHRIRKITPAGVVTTLAGSGTAGFSDATGTNAQFNTPIGVYVDSSDNVYVGDIINQRIRRITQAGVVSTLAGSGAAGFSDAMGTNAQFNFPTCVCIDSYGNLYVSDLSNQLIRKIAAPPMVVTTFAGTGVSGFSDATGTGAQFNNPFASCIDSNGNMYVGDTSNNRIRKITPAGVVTTFAGSGATGFSDASGTNAQFSNPRGVCIDSSANLYVADRSNNRIRKITPAGVVTTFAGAGVTGFSDATGTNARFNSPFGLCVDLSGNVYVADSSNHRIRKITAAGVVTTLAGSGVSGFSDANGTNAQFNLPYGVCVDLNGTVYVADRSNNRIRKITPAGVVSTLAGSGATGSADATGTNAQFWFPNGICLDSTGNLNIADINNQRIRRITPAGVVTTLAGGISGFRDATGANAQFKLPTSVCVDSTGNVYVTDQSNHCIRKISPLSSISVGLVASTTVTLPNGSTTAAFTVKYNSSGVSQWAVTVDGTSPEASTSVTTDASANVYVAGYYGPNAGTLYQNSTSAGITLAATSGGTAAFGTKINSSGAVQWCVSVDGTGGDRSLGCGVDSAGSFYLAGSYGPAQATVYNAANTASAITLPAASNIAAFLIKYNSSGAAQWANTIRGVSSNVSYSVALDSADNIYMSGTYQGATSPVIFAPNNSNTPFTLPAPTGNAGSNTAGYVVKYNSSGVPQAAWAISGTSNCASYSVDVDGSGSNVALAGLFTGATNTVMYDANANPSGLTFPSGITTQAAHVVKYNIAQPPLTLRSSASNGQQKYITNIGNSNLPLNLTNSNNSQIVNSYTLSAGSTALLQYYGSNWYKVL